jgi:hypothetical protein
MGEALWANRLRWRMRGATLWPAFAVAVLVDGVLLDVLPVAGDEGPGLFAAVILAGFLNLIVVAVGAPLAGRWLRRRRPGMPKVVATDKAGTALLAVVALSLVILGVVHRPAVRDADADLAAQAAEARSFVLRRAPPEYRTNVERMDTWKQGPQLYRTCVPGPDSRRAFCVIVNTERTPPSVARDRDQRPNATAAGTDGARRR